MAGLSEGDVQQQIEQMIKFIRQEAEEKAEEIRVKAEEDFNIMKQDEVETEHKRIRQEYERKEKQVDIERKIAHSNAVNQNRLKVLKARDDCCKKIVEQAREQIAKHATGDKYKDLLKKLVIQGALALQETTISVQCRKSDKGLVSGVLGDAVKEVKTRSGKDVTISVDEKSFLPDTGCSGGVVLTALDGAIRCDNTLDTRLNLAVEGMLPEIRITLFGRSAVRKHLN